MALIRSLQRDAFTLWAFLTNILLACAALSLFKAPPWLKIAHEASDGSQGMFSEGGSVCLRRGGDLWSTYVDIWSTRCFFRQIRRFYDLFNV